MPFIIEDDETPQPQQQGRYVIEGDSPALEQATSPSRTPKASTSPSPSGHLAGALAGVGEGLAGFAGLAKYLGRELYETPSRIGQMYRNPSIIPGVAAQTGREALALVTDPKAIAAGVGTALGGPSVGTAGAVGYQTLHDIMRRLGGEDITPQEMTKHLAETTTSFGAPQALGQLSRLGGPALRTGVRMVPGSGAALQKNVLSEARQAIAGVPKPPVRATAEELAAGRAAQAEQAAAQEAAYQGSLRQARAAGVEKVREAGQLPVVEKPYAQLEDMGSTLRSL